MADTSLVLKSEAFLDNQFVELTNAMLDIANNTIGTVNLKGYRADGAAIRLDVNTAENVSDVLNISGDLTGTTNLILNMLSSKEQTADIVFAKTPGDNAVTSGHFVIARLVGNPYAYQITTKYDAVNNNGCSRRKRNRPRYRNPSRSRRSFVRWRRNMLPTADCLPPRQN